MKIVLYSNDCPRCKVLEKKLGQKKINFEVDKDFNNLINITEKLGIQSLPILQVENDFFDFAGANKFINNL